MRELLGQLLRLVAAGLITWVWMPVGNSGHSRVSILTSEPIRELGLAHCNRAPRASGAALAQHVPANHCESTTLTVGS